MEILPGRGVRLPAEAKGVSGGLDTTGSGVVTLLDIVDVSLWSLQRSLSLKSSSSWDDAAAANVTSDTSVEPSMLPVLMGSPRDVLPGLAGPCTAASMEAARVCWQWLNAQHCPSLIIFPSR